MENSMMLVQATWQESQTFRMIPVSESCPYVECIFDPGTKVFVIISKIKRTSLQMLPKLDEYGQPITGAKGHKEERHKQVVSRLAGRRYKPLNYLPPQNCTRKPI
jgi:hypothetical protein